MHAFARRKPAQPDDAQQLSLDRYEIVDALHRFAAGQDLRDPRLLASAFSIDARLDFVQPARQFGVDMPVLRGGEAIAAAVVAALAEIDTTHTVTNARSWIEGDAAELYALVEAQHLARADRARNLLLKNHYRLELRRAGPRWEITSMRIDNAWHRGDPEVLFPNRTATSKG